MNKPNELNIDELYIADEAERFRYAAQVMPKVDRIIEAKVLDDLTYRSYRAQRHLYGIAFDRCKLIFEDAERYEIRYQDELETAQANAGKMYKGKSKLSTQNVS